MAAPGSAITYGRIAQGIVSAQQRLTAIGLIEGQTVGLHVAHPIEHMVLACALYRMRIASASITKALDGYLDHVPFDAVLSDSILPAVNVKQPAARFVIVDPSWFQDQVTFSMAQRTSSRRDPAPDWVSRITCYPNDSVLPAIVKTTSRSLEAQLLSYNISAPPNWERMILVAGLHTNTGFLQALSALWLGRSVCFADIQSVRHLISLYKHDYLVASTEEIEPLLKLQETNFVAIHALRAACFEGRACHASTIVRGLTTISSNLWFRYIRPEIGIVAYGDTGRFRNIEGAVGFVAPWVEVQVVDVNAALLTVKKEGALRFRPREKALVTSAKEAQESIDGWIYPNQRAQLMTNNLLVIQA
jgi:hypothetical protein